MLNQNIMILSDEVGRIVSPTIKIILLGMMIFIDIKLYLKFTQRKSVLALMLLGMITSYALATLFSSFDVLLGWQNMLGENTFLGMGLAFLMSGIAITFYAWMLIEVFYGKANWNTKMKVIYGFLAFGLIGFTTISLILRIQKNGAAFYFTAVFFLVTLYVIGMLVKNAFMMAGRVHEEIYKKRFYNMAWSAFSLFFMMVFFIIDSLYVEFTIYSLIGWTCVAISLYFTYKSYI
jgi:hypothetical protein